MVGLLLSIPAMIISWRTFLSPNTEIEISYFGGLQSNDSSTVGFAKVGQAMRLINKSSTDAIVDSFKLISDREYASGVFAVVENNSLKHLNEGYDVIRIPAHDYIEIKLIVYFNVLKMFPKDMIMRSAVETGVRGKIPDENILIFSYPLDDKGSNSSIVDKYVRILLKNSLQKRVMLLVPDKDNGCDEDLRSKFSICGRVELETYEGEKYQSSSQIFGYLVTDKGVPSWL